MEEERLHEELSSRELWFGVAAGPILWFVHLLISYWIVALHCNWRFFSLPMLGQPGLVTLLTIITLLFVGVVLYAGWAARRNWRRVVALGGNGAGDESDRVWEQNQFLSLSGMLLSALFAVVILLSLIPTFVLGPCAVL